MSLVGLFGRPYVDLSYLVEDARWQRVHEEICTGLAQVETTYTGGSLKWMGVAAPWTLGDAYADLGHVIEALPDDQWRRLVSLADEPERFDAERRAEYQFGDETDHPLNAAQARWLELRHGVYFPWKVVYHFVENQRWEDNHSGAGKDFGDEARSVFPETCALIADLPFTEVGRAVLFGLQSNDHATVHRDSEPGRALAAAQSINLCPAGNKRFYLCDAAQGSYTPVTARAYWFNDMDYHGVEPDPWFRYSIRVDGVFTPGFAADLARRLGR